MHILPYIWYTVFWIIIIINLTFIISTDHITVQTHVYQTHTVHLYFYKGTSAFIVDEIKYAYKNNFYSKEWGNKSSPTLKRSSSLAIVVISHEHYLVSMQRWSVCWTLLCRPVNYHHSFPSFSVFHTFWQCQNVIKTNNVSQNRICILQCNILSHPLKCILVKHKFK